MSIILKDLRTAVQDYVNEHVVATLDDFQKVGDAINPGETFTFTLNVKNPEPNAIKLVNVRYHLQVKDPTLAKLIVPSTNPFNGFRYQMATVLLNGVNYTDLKPNDLVAEMFISQAPSKYSTEPLNYLEAGQTCSIKGLTGKAIGPKTGLTEILCTVLADPDMSFLFPHCVDKTPAKASVTVTS